MRRIWIFLLCLLLCIGFTTPCTAATDVDVISYHEEDLGYGFAMSEIITLVNANSRSMDRAASKYREYTYNDEVIARIEISCVFRYDGSAVSVVSKSISQCDTYNGWSFKQSSFTSSGGTVTLTGKLNKFLILNASVNMSLTCDKNGNIS